MIADLTPYPAMKDSGVPWLGEVPEHWKVSRLRNAVDMRVSNVDKHRKEGELPVRLCNYVDVYKNDRITDRVLFMGATAMVEEIERFRLEPGDVLITKDSEAWNDIGVPAIVEYTAEDLVCGYHLALLRPRKELLNGGYLLRALQSPAVTYQFHVAANGVTRYGLSHDAIKSVLLPIPPLSEQAAIVRFLGHADRRIRRYIHARQKLIKLLEEQKQAIIHRAVTRGLDPNVRLKRSGVEWLGDVPEHWETQRLKTLVTQSVAGPYGSSLTKAMYTQAGYRVYGQQQVIPDNFSVGDYYISEEKYEEMSRYRVFPDDVLVSVMGTVGRVAVVPESVEPGIINPRLVRYRPNLEKVRPRYLQMAMSSTTTQVQVTEGAKGTTMEGLNMQILDRLLLAVPPLAEQDTILATVGADTKQLDQATRAATQGISLLREYRTRLIADVVTGKLDVREVAARLPDEADAPEALQDTDALTEGENETDEADLDAIPDEAET